MSDAHANARRRPADEVLATTVTADFTEHAISDQRNAPLDPQIDPTSLRIRIIRSLQDQGFIVQNGTIRPPFELSKERIRRLHETAVQHQIQRRRAGLVRKEEHLLRHIASGSDIRPSKTQPRLVEVLPGSEEELLFRYASLHWSIPVSSGYGRRLRFLVVDDYNGKLIGVIGLGDPVYSLKPRDTWIGWTRSDRRLRLRNVMDAFVLGAVPPYSFLLCGKLVAMLATSDTVRNAFKRKYGGKRSLIRNTVHDGRLALITTASALGRSSIYNRLRFDNRLLYRSVGFTKGSGDFHFSNGLYTAITEFAREHCDATAKHELWGRGFRNRREVVKKCLPALGLSDAWLYHGIKRELFVVPSARNTNHFLRGEDAHLDWYDQSEQAIFAHFRDRWMLPRYARDKGIRPWSSTQWQLWPHEGTARHDALSTAAAQHTS